MECPVLEGLDIHEGLVATLQCVLVHFSEGGRHGSERGLQVSRQARSDLLQPFVDKLPGQVLIERVIKDDRDHREAQCGDRAHGVNVRLGSDPYRAFTSGLPTARSGSATSAYRPLSTDLTARCPNAESALLQCNPEPSRC